MWGRHPPLQVKSKADPYLAQSERGKRNCSLVGCGDLLSPRVSLNVATATQSQQEIADGPQGSTANHILRDKDKSSFVVNFWSRGCEFRSRHLRR